MRTVSVAVFRVVVAEGREAGQRTAGELLVRRQDAGVDDVDADAGAVPGEAVRSVERQGALVEPIEAPGRSADGLGDEHLAILFDTEDTLGRRQPFGRGRGEGGREAFQGELVLALELPILLCKEGAGPPRRILLGVVEGHDVIDLRTVGGSAGGSSGSQAGGCWHGGTRHISGVGAGGYRNGREQQGASGNARNE